MAGPVLASAGIAVVTDGQFSVLIRALGVAAGSLGVVLVVYGVLRLTRLLPRRGPGRRRLGKDSGPTSSGK
jgi:hypothetical protein